MRVIMLIVGLLSLAGAALSAVPVIVLLCYSVSALSSSAAGIIHYHTDFILSVGSWSISGWQMWVLVAGLAIFAVLLGAFGLYVLLPRRKA